MSEVIYGCVVDLPKGEVFLDCVLDEGGCGSCTHSNCVNEREECQFWRAITKAEQELVYDEWG